jgi:hypothetical protein
MPTDNPHFAPSPAPAPTDSPDFRLRATMVGSALRDAFADLIGSVDPKVLRVAVNATFRSKLGQALEQSDGLASLFFLPGPEGLHQIITSVARYPESHAQASAIEKCESSVRAFAAFLHEEDVSRETLQAILSGFLPEARTTVMRSAAQGAFRGLSQVIGYCADSYVGVRIVLPGDDPMMVTEVHLHGEQDWRCIRADRWEYITSRAAQPRETAADGSSLEGLVGPALLTQFCSKPLPNFEPIEKNLHPDDGFVVYRLVSNEVGVRSARSWFMGTRYPDANPRFRSAIADSATQGTVCATPYKQLLLDVLVHNDVWRGVEPTVLCHRTVRRGPVGGHLRKVLEARAADQVPHDCTLRTLAPGLRGIESAGVRTLRPMVEWVLSRLGYHPDHFRGYRITRDYPVYGNQYGLWFDLPEKA